MGMIGLIATLKHLGRISAGEHRVETPVGIVTATLHDDGRVSIRNVPSYRQAKGVKAGGVTGDVAWGGNWFFLVADHGLDLTLKNVPQLTQASLAMREAVRAAGYPEVDHVELFGPPHDAANHSRNFVLCPGGEYDRSPCGTGTSAKLACLAADGKLAPGEVWRQESILGSVFEGSYENGEGGIIPRSPERPSSRRNDVDPRSGRPISIRHRMKSRFFRLCFSLSAFAADFDAALSLPKRTENKVFRDRVKANWLPDGKTFWYRVQTGRGSHEFVLIDATTAAAKRRDAQRARFAGKRGREDLHDENRAASTKRTGEDRG
jgi:hypothetical protein